MNQLPNNEKKELTPIQELLIHFQDKFGYRSGHDFDFWIDKEKNALRKAYDEGVEDGGYFGNGKDYVDRTFNNKIKNI